MKSILKKIDDLPIVEILQIVGALMFVIGLIGFVITLPRYANVSPENMVAAIQTLLMGALQVVSTPAMLLGLAQVVKYLKARA